MIRLRVTTDGRRRARRAARGRTRVCVVLGRGPLSVSIRIF